MERLINQPPSTIKLDVNELLLVSDYIVKHIDFFNTNEALALIRKWHLIELYNKIEKGVNKTIWSKKKYSLKVNEIERHAISILFNKFECKGYMIVISEQFIKGLIKINSNAA